MTVFIQFGVCTGIHCTQIVWVGLKSDGTTGQTTGHLAARASASRYMARRKATRQATELTTIWAYYMLYSYVTVYLLVDKPKLYVNKKASIY